jgi:transcriptional regulator with XRE-family HTH domain
MEEKLSFGKFIVKKRRDKQFTQKELAEKLYVTESAVSKWERGISYPDISLVSSICSVLGISEHELITASEDLHQREIEKQAKKYRRIIKVYSWLFFLIYGVSLLICLISNVAAQHSVSWFFIVLAAEMIGFSLTSLPLLLNKNQGLWTICAFFISLNLLLMVCCIYTHGDWFWVSFFSLLFAFSVVFLPFVVRNISLPQCLYSHKVLLCLSIDSLLLFVLIAVGCAYDKCFNQFFPVAFPTALFALLLPWFLMVAIRYIKVNALFRTAICFFGSSIYILTLNSVLKVIEKNESFSLPVFNLYIWNDFYFQNNIIIIVTIVCFSLTILFSAGGIVYFLKKQKS